MQRRRRISLTQTDRTTTAGLELLGLLQEIVGVIRSGGRISYAA